MTDIRSRASVVESRAGDTPSVNLPILPVVPQEAKGVFRWATALTTQLEIWFEQLKGSIIQLYNMTLERPTWDSGYEAFQNTSRNTIVEDEGWLMVSNTRTSERAAPQPIGPAEALFVDSPAWTPAAVTALVRCSTLLTLDQDVGVRCTEFRVWVPDTSPTYLFLFEVVITPPGGLPVSTLYYDPILIADQWNVLAFADKPLAKNSTIELIGWTLDVSTTTPLAAYDYRWEGLGGNKLPEAGGITSKGGNKLLRISKFDANGFDRSVQLASVPEGSFLNITDTEAERRYSILEPGTDEGDYYLFNDVRLFENVGSVVVGNIYSLSGSLVTAGNTDYVTYPAYFPANDPTYATATGALRLGTVDQPSQSGVGFGLDITGIPSTVSADWDFMAYSTISAAPDARAGSAGTARWVDDVSFDVKKGEVSTVANGWVEILRYFVNDSHYGKMYTKAVRTDGDDIYNSEYSFNCLLTGSTLTVKSTKIFDDVTTSGLRVRVDDDSQELVFEVDGKSNQDWDWKMSVLNNFYD